MTHHAAHVPWDESSRHAAEDHLVPKVHPLTRESTEEDPFALMAEPVPGDPQVMLECMLQEFAWLGYAPEQLLALFYDPGYPVLCQLREHFGDDVIREKVHAMAAAWGVLRFQETIAEPEQAEPELVQITDLTHGQRAGCMERDNHGPGL